MPGISTTWATALGSKRGLRRYIGPKRGVAIAMLGLLIAAGWYLRKAGLLDPALLQSIVADHPVGSVAAFVALYGLATLSALPALPLNLAAGFYWGALVGGTLSAAGATLGAIAAFAAARLAFGRPLAGRFDNRLIAEIQREFAAKGWWFLAFVRLNPIFPTGPLNFIFGLTSIRARIYTLVTFVFLVPPSVAIAFMGRSIGTFAVTGDLSERLRIVLVASAVITALAALMFAARLVNRYRSGNLPRSE